MNYFDIYFEGLALIHSRLVEGIAANEGLLHPVPMAAIKIVSGVPLEDNVLVFNPH